jgi:hypothetical protein
MVHHKWLQPMQGTSKFQRNKWSLIWVEGMSKSNANWDLFKCKRWWNSAIVYYHLNEINQFVYIWVIIATIMHSHNHKYLFFDSSLVPWYLKFQRRFIGGGFRLCRITLRFISHPFWKLSVGQFQTEIYLAHSQVKRHKKSVFSNLSFWSFFFPQHHIPEQISNTFSTNLHPIFFYNWILILMLNWIRIRIQYISIQYESNFNSNSSCMQRYSIFSSEWDSIFTKINSFFSLIDQLIVTHSVEECRAQLANEPFSLLLLSPC